MDNFSKNHAIKISFIKVGFGLRFNSLLAKKTFYFLSKVVNSEC